VNKGVKDKGGGEKNAHQHTPLIPFLPRRLFPVLNLQSQKMPFFWGNAARALTFLCHSARTLSMEQAQSFKGPQRNSPIKKCNVTKA
jgi:hypothetical protein